MDRDDTSRDPDGVARIRGVSLKLHVDDEMIDVWLDDSGIHFSHPDGTSTQGHLPWGIAIAMSLIPPQLPRMAEVTAA
jgi:hypothetical protein